MAESSNSLDLGYILESKEQMYDFTPEDIAWADSCLIKEIPDISDSNWSNVKDALLEILNLHSEKLDSPAAPSENFQGSNIDIEMLSSDNDEPPFPTGGTKYDLVSIEEKGVETGDSQYDTNINTYPSIPFRGNPFLPTYKDDVQGGDNVQTGPSLDFSATESESPSCDIFRLWDLNLPAMDEIIEHLNKALPGNSVQPVLSKADDFGAPKGFEKGDLDHLINSISGLSLKQNN